MDIGVTHDVHTSLIRDVAKLPILDVRHAMFSNPAFNALILREVTPIIHEFYSLDHNKKLYPSIYVQEQQLRVEYQFTSLINASNTVPRTPMCLPGFQIEGSGEIDRKAAKDYVRKLMKTKAFTKEGDCTVKREKSDLPTHFKNTVILYSDAREFSGLLAEINSVSEDDEIIATQIGPIVERQLHGVSSNVAQWYLGVIKRVIPDLRVVDKDLLNEFRTFVRNFVTSNYTTLPYVEPTREFLETWLEGSKYNISQKEGFRSAFDAYMRGEITQNIFACNSFIKKELYDELKYGRIINSRSDQFKAVVAPYIKQVEEQVFSSNHFVKHHHPSFTAERLQEIHRAYGTVVETDYSSFEGSFTTEIMAACELQLFEYILADNPTILSLVRDSYLKPNKIVFRDKSSFQFRGSRMSGEMWTSLANGFTNAMLLEFCAHKAGAEVDYLVEGDDGFYGTTNSFDSTIVTRLGFRLKIEEVMSINECSFCGVKVNAEGTNVGDAMKQLNNLGMTCDPGCLQPRARKRRRYMIKAKMMSAQVIFGDAPIMSKCIEKELLSQLHNTSTQRQKFKQLIRQAHYWVERIGLEAFLDEKPHPFNVTHRDRLQFEEVSNVHVNEQIAIENEVSSCEHSLYMIRALQ